MNDDACISFLQWALPHLHLRWAGFRKVRGQVRKRLGRRLEELGLKDLKNYRTYLENTPMEWHILDSICRITTSRFYRDRGVFNVLSLQVFPGLIENACHKGDKTLSCWCIGAASGEEPYSISLLWEFSELQKGETTLIILATEIDQHMINRAREGCYPPSSIDELPPRLKKLAFVERDAQFHIKEEPRKRVQFVQQDIRNEQPDSAFDLILCRNLVFTYFSLELQEETTRQIIRRLKPGGGLVIGSHEEIPASVAGLETWLPGQNIYRRNP